MLSAILKATTQKKQKYLNTTILVGINQISGNMLTEKQLRIINVFQSNVFKEYTFNELKEQTGEKSNNFLQLSIKKFLDENLIYSNKIGKTNLYNLNLKNEKLYSYISLLNLEILSKKCIDSIQLLVSELEKYSNFYSLVIFGSHAIHKETNNSDLDIALFIENEADKKEISFAINSTILKSVQKLDIHIISKDEFSQMLNDEDWNLGKEIGKKHKAIINPKIFYSMLKKEVESGFKI